MLLVPAAFALPTVLSPDEVEVVPIGAGLVRDVPDPQIVNGTPTLDHENVVALAQVDGSGFAWVFCSGTLVHERYVITAAHCLTSWPTGQGYALFGGDLFANELTDVRYVSDLWAHPDYDATDYLNDIGVVELDTPVTGVRLAAVNDDPPNNGWLGDELRFVGFGDPTDGAFQTGVKRYTDIPMLNWDNQYLYSGHPDSNVCQGDSGGAAFEVTAAGYELAGVNAFVINGCAGGDNGATRVDAFLPWLQQYIPVMYTDPALVPAIDPEADTDADADADADTDADTDADGPEFAIDDTGWGAPVTPVKNAYPRGLRCNAAPGAIARLVGALSRR